MYWKVIDWRNIRDSFFFTLIDNKSEIIKFPNYKLTIPNYLDDKLQTINLLSRYECIIQIKATYLPNQDFYFKYTNFDNEVKLSWLNFSEKDEILSCDTIVEIKKSIRLSTPICYKKTNSDKK